MKPNRITVSRSARGTTIKATGHAAQALFDRLAAETDASVGASQIAKVYPCTIHFQDHGQDFLEWDIDAKGTVVDSRPHQAWVWKGCRLLDPPKPGAKVRYISAADGQEKVILYPVRKVTQQIGGVGSGGTGADDKLSP